jgi:hypothetical protein
MSVDNRLLTSLLFGSQLNPFTDLVKPPEPLPFITKTAASGGFG